MASLDLPPQVLDKASPAYFQYIPMPMQSLSSSKQIHHRSCQNRYDTDFAYKLKLLCLAFAHLTHCLPLLVRHQTLHQLLFLLVA